MKSLKKRTLLMLPIISMLITSSFVFAENNSILNVNLDGNWSDSVNSIIFLTILMLSPFIIMVCTCFPRYIMSLSFLRQSMGLNNIPSNQVLIGVAFFMTLFTMKPVYTEIVDTAYKPYTEKVISSQEMLTKTKDITKEFMLKNTREKDLLLFAEHSGLETLPDSRQELDFSIVAPAFLVSEFTKTFWIGLLMYILFIMIDFIVASVLMSMGMVMLPPMTISIMVKLIVFLAADGWYSVLNVLMNSFK